MGFWAVHCDLNQRCVCSPYRYSDLRNNYREKTVRVQVQVNDWAVSSFDHAKMHDRARGPKVKGIVIFVKRLYSTSYFMYPSSQCQWWCISLDRLLATRTSANFTSPVVLPNECSWPFRFTFLKLRHSLHSLARYLRYTSDKDREHDLYRMVFCTQAILSQRSIARGADISSPCPPVCTAIFAICIFWPPIYKRQ